MTVEENLRREHSETPQFWAQIVRSVHKNVLIAISSVVFRGIGLPRATSLCNLAELGPGCGAAAGGEPAGEMFRSLVQTL